MTKCDDYHASIFALIGELAQNVEEPQFEVASIKRIGPTSPRNLKARDQASKIIVKILNDAKGGDPKPEIEKAIAKAPVRSALRRNLIDLSVTPRGGRMRMPQPLMALPKFYRR